MAIAGKAIQDFNNSISQYGNLENAVSNYVSQKRNDIYDNWKQGVLSKLNIDQEKKEELNELIGMGSSIPASARGAYKAYKAYQAKKTASGATKDDSTGSKSTGADDGGDKSGKGDDATPDENTTSSKQPDAVDDDESKSSEPAEEEEDQLEDPDPDPSPLSASDLTSEPPSVTTKSSINQSEDATEDATQATEDATQATEDVTEATKDATQVAGNATKAGETATKVAGDVADVADATEATEGASALTGVVEGLGVAADVIAPVALVGGVAYGLYELFHHGSSKKAQQEPKSVANPYIQTAFNTSGNIVLPSESNMLDTVGGHSVF